MRREGPTSEQEVAVDAGAPTGPVSSMPLLAVMQHFGGNRAMTALLTEPQAGPDGPAGAAAPTAPAPAVVTDRPGPPPPLDDPNFNPTQRAHDLSRAIDSAEHTVEMLAGGVENVDAERRKIDFPVALAALDGLTPSQVAKVEEVFSAINPKATLRQCLFEGGESGRRADLTDDQRLRLRVLMSGTRPDPVPAVVMGQLRPLEPQVAGQLKVALEYRPEDEALAAMHRYEADAIELHELLKDPLNETRRERVMELHRRKPVEIEAVDAMYAKNYNAGVLATDLNSRLEGLQRMRMTALRQGDAGRADAFAIEDKRQQIDKLARDYDMLAASLGPESFSALGDERRREQQKLTKEIQAIIDLNRQEALKEAESTGRYAGEVVAERIRRLMQTQVGVPGHTLGADLGGSLAGEDNAVITALTDPWASGSGNLVQAAAAQLAADEAAGTTSAKKITATLRSFRTLADQDLRAQAFDARTPMEQRLAIQRDGEYGVGKLAQRYIEEYRAAYDRIAGGRGRSFDQIVASADDADEFLITNLSNGGGQTSDQGELDHAIRKRDVEAVLKILRDQPNAEKAAELEAAYNGLGGERDLRKTLFGWVTEGHDEFSISYRPATAEEAMSGVAAGGLVKGRDAALVNEQLGKPTQTQLEGPDRGAAAKADWYAEGGLAEYRATWDNRGATGRLRQIGDDPETQKLLERSRDELAALKARFDSAPEGERAKLVEQMRKLRDTLSGDAAAYEQDNERVRGQIQSALSFAVSLALAVAIPGAGPGLVAFLQTTALNIAATVATNFVIKAGDYGLADLKADVLGGVLGAAGGKFGEELLGRLAGAIVKPAADATVETAAKLSVETVLAKEVGSLAAAGERAAIQAEEFILQASGREAAETATKEAAETATKEAAETATKEAGEAAAKAPMTLLEKGAREVGGFFGGIYGPKVLTIGDPKAAGEGGFAGLTIEELLKALATTLVGKAAHRKPAGSSAEEPAARRPQEEPAARQAAEEPAAPRPQEEPAGSRQREEAAGPRAREEPAGRASAAAAPDSHPQQDLLLKNGIPPKSAAGFQDAADGLDVMIWVRPTNQASLPVLSKGGVAKPEIIKAKTVNQADLLIGGPADGLGKVGFFDPVMPSPEVLDMLTPADRQTVLDRVKQRREEYGKLKTSIDEQVADGLIRVQDGVLQIADPRTAATPDATKGQFRDIGGDHDLYRITDRNGDPIPDDVRRGLVKQLQSMGINVEHPDLVSWPADSPGTFHQGQSDQLRQRHETSEPLVVFAPKSPPRLALAGEALAGPPRTEGPGDRFLPAASGQVIEPRPADPSRPGETDFSVPPRHATPEEIAAARETDPVSASRKGRGGGTHGPELRVSPDATAFHPDALVLVEQQLRTMSQKGWDTVFASLSGEGRVHPLTDEALAHVYGPERAAEILAGNPIDAALGGLYIADANSAGQGHMFLSPGSVSDVAVTTVHETVHYLQDLHAKHLTTLKKELQAWLAQREYLREVERAGGEMSADNRALLETPTEHLADVIAMRYNLPFENVRSVARETETVLAMVRTFKGGAGPATTPAGPTGTPAKADNTDFDHIETVDIDPAEMKREALLAEIGAPSGVRTLRETEVPYTMPPDVREAKEGQPLNLDELNPNRRYLWVVTEEGRFLVADEGQADFFPRRDRIEPGEPAAGETPLKHGDLAPGPDGKTRGKARAGGNLYAQTGADGKRTGSWVLDADSSYMFARKTVDAQGRDVDAPPPGPGSLDAVRKLLEGTGTDVSRIMIDRTILLLIQKK